MNSFPGLASSVAQAAGQEKYKLPVIWYFCLSCSTRTRWRCTGSSSLFIVSITLLLISSSAFFIIARSSSWFCSCWTKEIELPGLCRVDTEVPERPAVLRNCVSHPRSDDIFVNLSII